MSDVTPRSAGALVYGEWWNGIRRGWESLTVGGAVEDRDQIIRDAEKYVSRYRRVRVVETDGTGDGKTIAEWADGRRIR